MKKRETMLKLLLSVCELALVGICTVAALLSPIETTAVKIAGSFVSVALVSAAAWFFPLRFYVFALVFHFFAAPLGSVINLYKYLGCYDRIVHYLSGIILAEAGLILISRIFKKRGLKDDIAVKLLFAFFFSAACAGFWEIYEFTADSLLHIDMQGSNLNTMGDIVSGVLGAATYTAASFISIKRNKNADLI